MFDELGDGVFRRRYASLDLNVGVVIGESGPDLGDRFRKPAWRP